MNRLNNSTYGKTGESLAEQFLKNHGYHILAGNYIVDGGELDVVAFKRGTLVFVEVKTRSNFEFGTPAEAVDIIKQKRVVHAARIFVAQQSKYGKIPVFSRLFRRHFYHKIKKQRFDIIEVVMPRNLNAPKINHIENAF